jgi:peptidyl-prolyl cis-trans isomerase A (cyclophilin A)
MRHCLTARLPRLVKALPVVLLALNCRRVDPPGQEESAPKPSALSPTGLNTTGGAASSTPVAAAQSSANASGAISVQPVPQPAIANSDDPVHGKFTLSDATAGLKGKGRLWAEIETDKGKLRCELYDDKAPNTVANFVGLARGLRPFKDPKTSEWVERPGYDGTGFHRIIKGFMIQGGDPKGTGAGEPGYVFADEVWPGATHDRRGLMCMANRGPNTNGMQFFILDGQAKHLDVGYTIFGHCTPDSVIEKLANTEVRGDRAIVPPKINKIKISRK